MKNLKKIRKEKQFTQKQLADTLKITEAQFNRIENEVNNANEKQILALCNALNVSADELLGLIELKKEKK